MDRHLRRTWLGLLSGAALVVTMVAPASSAVLAGANERMLGRQPLVSPEELASPAPPNLEYADPTSGLSLVDPPTASSTGAASLSYPIVLPKGRGLMPELSIDYDSGSGGSWVGQGWSLGVGEVTVDTTFGVPRFCPRASTPACGNYETESYRLNGELLMPTAQTANPQPRVKDRSDWTRQVETRFERIERHGDSPENYTWEVTDKDGNASFYGMFPDMGGYQAEEGTRTGDTRNDKTLAESAVLRDGPDPTDNIVTWYLKAKRDVGVNMIRYEYKTLYYKATKETGGHSTRWVGADKTDCTSAVTCAKHVYLDRIFYTGVGEQSPVGPQGEDPAYEVEFVRGGNRADARIDARGGFLDLDREQLAAIKVYSLKPKREQALEYRLGYTTKNHGKELLTSITQVGCADSVPPAADPPACDESTAAAHTFGYYDDAKGKTLATSRRWDTGDDSMGNGRLEGRAGALGMSATNAGDGHLYLGFNLVKPDKTGSFGGSLTFDGSTTESLLEFMDLNGDGLPDKVFRKEADLTKQAPIYYSRNTSTPATDPGGPVTFADAKVVDGLDRLPIERAAGFGAAIEAYLVVSASFTASGSWSWSDGYFNDVNGDGLPDFIKGGSVFFNHLTCTGTGESRVCDPRFAKSDDSQTRVPMTTQAVSDPAAAAAAAARRATLRRLSPPIDTVKRWVAPFDGTVSIASSATLLPCLDADTVGGVCPDAAMRLTVQHEDTVKATGQLAKTGETWTSSPSFHVAKGNRVYFRAGADPDFVGRSVAWAPTITYTGYDVGGTAPPADANGLSQKVYSAADDYTLAGRPGGFVSLPQAGEVLFGAVIEKAATSDDVRPTVTLDPGASGASNVDATVQVTPVTSTGAPDPGRLKSYAKNSAGKWCVADGSGTDYGCFTTDEEAAAQLQVLTKRETGRFVLGAKVVASAPVKAADGTITAQDKVSIRFGVDSPIDVTALRWGQPPRLCYGTTAGACDPKKPDLTPPVDTDIYPGSTDAAPRAPWQSTVSGDATVHVGFDVGDIAKVDSPGKVVLTVKSAADGYILKKEITPKSLEAGSVDFTATFAKGTNYWFDLSIRVPGLGEKVTNAAVTVTPAGSKDPAKDKVSVPVTVNTVGRQGWFPLSYRGWGVAGYLANLDRGTKALTQGDFDLLDSSGQPYKTEGEACQAMTGGACMKDTDVDGLTFPGTYSSDPDTQPTFDPNTVESKFSKAYGYIPEVGTDKAGLLTETWEGPNDHLGARRLGLSSALLAGGLPPADGSSGLTPPQLEGSTGPVLAGTIGFGPAAASFGFGWSRSFVDYMDMNGDGFPDKVTTDSVTYTNPRGGQGCKAADGSVAACTGSGVAAVNQDTTFAVGGGLSGSPVKTTANARGVPNATQGASASKGGGTSADAYGASIGAGFGISASFGSPNAADPSWKPSDVNSKTSKIPGDPIKNDTDLAIQQLLADVNGDGLPDRVKTTPKGISVWFNLGYGFAANSVPWASGGFESSEGYTGAIEFGVGFSGPGKDFAGGVSRNASVNFPRYSWADVNGDGILDALHRDDTDGTVQIAYGTGTGLTSGSDLGVDDSVPFRLIGDITVPIKDQIRQDQSVGWGAGADVTIGFGPLCVAFCYLIVGVGVHYENSLGVSDVDLQDVNGDGFSDSVRRVPADADENQEQLDVQLNTHGRTGLLETVTNPMRGVTTLDYERYGNTSDHPGSTYALSSVSVDDARPGDGVNVARTTIDYDQPRYDFLRREELGFSRVESAELAADGSVERSTIQLFRNDTIFTAGLLTRSTTYDGPASDDQKLQRTVYAWDVLDGRTRSALNLATLTPDEQLAVWAVPERSDETQEWFAADGSTVSHRRSTHFDYDALGSPTTILDKGDPSNPADDLTATIRYSDCEISADADDQKGKCDDQEKDQTVRPAFWDAELCPTWVHTAARLTVTDDQGNVVRHRDGAPALCDNDSVTELNELISGPVVGGEYATTLLTYDAWGSYNRIVYPAGADPELYPRADGTHYAVKYVYDTERHADVAQVTNYQLEADEIDGFMSDPEPGDPVPPPPARIGLTTDATFDGPAGKVKTTTDANQKTTRYGYDAMGRLTSITTPDQQSVTFAYHPGHAAYGYATARHSDAFAPSGASDDDKVIDTVTFVDGTGRVTQQKREAEFFAGPGATAPGYVVSPPGAIDALGREVDLWFPQKQLGGALTAFHPAPPKTAPHTVTAYDGLDRVIESTAPGNRKTTTTYGAVTDAGRVLASTLVTDPLGRATLTLADLRGNVRVTEDRPAQEDPIRTDYEYTALGDLTKVVTAGVTESESTFDLLGRRLSTRTPDGGLVEYTYDASGHQVSSESPEQRANGIRTTFDYAFGNLVSVGYEDEKPPVVPIGGSGFQNPKPPEVTLGWGGYDKVSTAGNGAGRLVAVHDKARTQTLAYDVNGQPASETTAMNDDHWKRGKVTTTFTHDWLGRLGTMTYIDGEKVTNTYDSGGSLAEITGAKECTDLGTLAAAIDAIQTTITVRETPHTSPPVVPFTMTIGGEQLLVTDRVAGAGDTFTYTVVRGTNSTPLVPTAVPHAAGAGLLSDIDLTCSYRYLDRQEYDEFGDIAFRQLGNGNRTWSERDADTRALSRVVSTAPAQGTSLAGTLVAGITSGATSMTVKEAYVPPPVPFAARIGSEQVLVTARVETATKGTSTYTVTRGYGATSAAAHTAGAQVLTDRVQQNLTYSYDKVGNLEGYLNDLPADLSSLFGGRSSQKYGYDGYYRLESASGQWDTAPADRRKYTLALTYDATSGNVLTKNQSDWTERSTCTNRCKKATVDDTTYSFGEIGYRSPQQHQFTTVGADTYTYDRNGAVTSVLNPDNLRELAWDHSGHLTMVVDRPNGSGGKPTYYTYDHEGNRAIETKETGRIWSVNQWTTVRNGTMWKNIWAGQERLGTKFSEADSYEQKSYFFQKDLQGSTNIVSGAAGGMFQHHEYFPDGEVWADEASTVFRTAYQANGAYFDEDHELSDFGQRWFDARSQSFLSVDPAVYEDPMAAVSDPMVSATYTFAGSNPLVYGDPDGRAKTFINPTVNQRNALTKGLRISGQPLSQQQVKDINYQFALHRGVKGKLLHAALSNVDRATKRQELAEKWSMKPVLEFAFDLGADKLSNVKLSNVKFESFKLGAGVGPRKKWPAKKKTTAAKPPPANTQKSNGAGGNP